MKWAISILFVVGAVVAHCQGAFQDLDFEEAHIGPGLALNTANAFPGWQVFEGTIPITSVLYDNLTLGAGSISIHDDQSVLKPIQGNYEAVLEGAFVPPDGLLNITLSQTGVIPSGTESIVLDAIESQGASFVVTAGGQTVTLVPVQTISTYTVYEGNVSAWAGLDTTLSITEMGPSVQMYSPSLLELDNISFSPYPITVTPEPSPFLLTGIGGLLFGIYRCIQARRKC